MKYTVVLTSKILNSWQSIKEVLPGIIKSWKLTSSENHKVILIDVDDLIFENDIIHLIKADNLVLTCISPKILRIVNLVRVRLKIDSRFIIYLFDQSSISCWQLRYFAGDIFEESDVFISSSSADRECFKLTYPKAKCIILPFTLSTPRQHLLLDVKIPFIYIGRISSQKLLHTLLLSFYFLKLKNPDLNWSLSIIGSDDNLGSPNMGINQKNYLDYLIKLSTKLGLKDNVKFYGYMSPSQISRKISRKKYIFTSPSLHSDENFGLSALRFLLSGHLAVLSDWGGHKDFKKSFGKNVFLCPVWASRLGPVIQANEFSNLLMLSIKKYKFSSVLGDIKKYDYRVVSAKIADVAMTPKKSSCQKIISTKISDNILKKVINSMKKTRRSNKFRYQIFEGYEDINSHIFFKAYGMRDYINYPRKGVFIISPNVVLKNNIISIKDPHKGNRQLKIKKLHRKQATQLTTIKGKSVLVNQSAVNALQGMGYLEQL